METRVILLGIQEKIQISLNPFNTLSRGREAGEKGCQFKHGRGTPPTHNSVRIPTPPWTPDSLLADSLCLVPGTPSPHGSPPRGYGHQGSCGLGLPAGSRLHWCLQQVESPGLVPGGSAINTHTCHDHRLGHHKTSTASGTHMTNFHGASFLLSPTSSLSRGVLPFPGFHR